MSVTRQERRRRERQAYKNKRKQQEETYELPLQLLQPWSTPILKTILPPKVLQTMIEISDKVIAPSSCLCDFLEGKYSGILRYITVERLHCVCT